MLHGKSSGCIVCYFFVVVLGKQNFHERGRRENPHPVGKESKSKSDRKAKALVKELQERILF